MPDDLLPTTLKSDLLLSIPSLGPIAGRDREVEELLRFLKQDSEKPIILIHGPRGIGKTALAYKAANLCANDRPFKAVLWINRTRVRQLIPDDQNKKWNTLSPEKKSLLEYVQQESHILGILQSPAIDELPNGYRDFFITALATHQPYLIVIDDFDEFFPLTAEHNKDLLEQLARVKTPNKVIITTRLPDNNFQYECYQLLEVGLLNEQDVKKIITESHPDRFGLILDEAVNYLWAISGGHPEFIMRLVSKKIVEGWLLEPDDEWVKAQERFSAGYLTNRDQANEPESYQEEGNYEKNIVEYRKKINELGAEEKNVLFALANRLPDSPPLAERELSVRLGYVPQDYGLFHRAVEQLRRQRLISCRITLDDKNSGQSRLPILWPFAREFIKIQFDKMDQTSNLQKARADRWIKFIRFHAESAKQIVQQLDDIYESFRWCVRDGDWQRVVNMGANFSKILWDLNYQTGLPKQRFDLQYVCKQTIEAVQKLDNIYLPVLISQHIMLARFHSDTKIGNLAEQDIALEHARKAYEVIGEVGADWEEVVCLIAKINARRDAIEEAEHWLEEVEKRVGISTLDDWASTAYDVAKAKMKSGDFAQAQIWVDKALSSYKRKNNLLKCSQVSSEFAYFCLAIKDWDRALIYAQITEKYILDVSGGIAPDGTPSEFAEIRVVANIIMAEVAKGKGQVKECEDFLREARDLSKSSNLNPVLIADLNGWLEHIIRSGRDFTPARAVATILDKKLAWGIATQATYCPVCRKGLEATFHEEIRVCANCRTSYHLLCLSTIDYKCSICGTLQQATGS